jgi:hypothetical protein
MKRTLERESKVLEIAGIEGMASSSGSVDLPGARARLRPGGNWLSGLCRPVGCVGSSPGSSPRVEVRMDSRSVEKRLEKVAGAAPFAGSLRTLQLGIRDGLARIEVRKPTPAAFGQAGWRPHAAACGRGGMQCFASCATRCSRAVPTGAVWDPDEMVVIHPS